MISGNQLRVHCGNDVGRINKVTLRQAQLLLRWMAIRGYAVLAKLSLLPSVGWEITTTQEAVVVVFGWAGNCRSGIALATHE